MGSMPIEIEKPGPNLSGINDNAIANAAAIAPSNQPLDVDDCIIKTPFLL